MLETKIFCAFLVLLSSGVDCSGNADFREWKIKYKRSYPSESAEAKAFDAFLKSTKIVDSLNSIPGLSWEAHLGKFADLTTEDFREKILQRPQAFGLHSKEVSQLSFSNSSSVPASFDWRYDGSKTVVTSVKDQGFVGSCWAFSTVGNIEGQWALSGQKLTDLSPEFLVDCDGTSDEKHADCSVFGGWPYLAYQYVIKSGGIPSEADYPYCSGTGDCYPCMLGPISLCGPPPPSCDRSIPQNCPNAKLTASITSWSAVSTDETEIASTLYSKGPLSVLLDAAQLQYYKSGVWTGHVDGVSPYLGCSKDYLSHAVLLVGYGTDISSAEDGNTAEGAAGGKGAGSGLDYWSVKNSWGEDWGEMGYFRIQRGVGMCGINTAVTTANI